MARSLNTLSHAFLRNQKSQALKHCDDLNFAEIFHHAGWIND
jgi:hypothetical protein